MCEDLGTFALLKSRPKGELKAVYNCLGKSYKDYRTKLILVDDRKQIVMATNYHMNGSDWTLGKNKALGLWWHETGWSAMFQNLHLWRFSRFKLHEFMADLI